MIITKEIGTNSVEYFVPTKMARWIRFIMKTTKHLVDIPGEILTSGQVHKSKE